MLKNQNDDRPVLGVGSHLPDAGGFQNEQLRLETFQSSKAKKTFTVLPACRITTRLTGLESPGWRLFTDGGSGRNIDGTELSRWGDAIVSPENFVRVICGPVVLGSPATGVSRGPHPAATIPQNSLVLLRQFVGPIPSFLAVNVSASWSIPNTRHVSHLVLPMLRGTSGWPADAMNFSYVMSLATLVMQVTSALMLPPA